MREKLNPVLPPAEKVKDPAPEQEKKEQNFKPEIPRGWTELIHGTNLSKWADSDPREQLEIEITWPLSTITSEDELRGKDTGYDTTRNYSHKINPKGMSDEVFEKLNVSLEIRVVFPCNHHHLRDPEYDKSKLTPELLDLIAKYYFKNMQFGRHPLIPKGEKLIKLGQSKNEARDVIYFIPESVREFYEAEVEAAKERS